MYCIMIPMHVVCTGDPACIYASTTAAGRGQYGLTSCSVMVTSIL